MAGFMISGRVAFTLMGTKQSANSTRRRNDFLQWCNPIW